MKAVFVSDIHLGKYKYGKIDKETGSDLRTKDILNNIDQSIDFAIKKKVDYYFVLGDFYHTKKPLQIFRRLLASRISKVLKNNIIVYLLLGNHDQGKTAGHDLVELKEFDELIKNFNVIDKPVTIESNNNCFCFLPCINKIDHNIKEEEEHNYNLENIKLLTKQAEKSSSKYKFFFGHFGTNISQVGQSFDLGTVETKLNRVIDIKLFDKNLWTRVYLGDIHKNQEMNDFCRHPGSIARVDFGEEDEQKGFYYFEDGKDEFIPVQDREFKTLFLDLTNDPRNTMTNFCNEVQDLDLSKAIIRLKVKIKSSDKKLVNFAALENYLKEESWNYIGRSTIEIDDRIESLQIKMDDELDYLKIFNDYLTLNQDQIEKTLFNDIKSEGIQILSEIINSDKQ